MWRKRFYCDSCGVVNYDPCPARTRTLRRRTEDEGRPWLPSRVFWVLLAVSLTAVSPVAAQEETIESELKGVVGEEIEIPCKIGPKDECGDIHSVRWYHNEGDRIVMYSAEDGFSSLSGPFQPNRATFVADQTPPILRISPIEITDEGSYRCDVTYTLLKSGCPIVTTTELKTVAKPQSPEIELEHDRQIEGSDSRVTATLIGPFYVEEYITLTCEASGGKPPAQVTWWNGSQSLGGYFSEEYDDDGTGTGRNSVRMHVTKSDLLARYECQVNHETLEGTLVSWIQMDVFVPPQELEFKGDDTLFEKETVSMTCSAKGARPAATITWYNGSEPLAEQPPMAVDAEKGGTFMSASTLTFAATRFDDEEMFSCQASNQAMDDGRTKPLKDSATLTVLYSPLVRMLPDEDLLEIHENDTLRLECAFEGNPANQSTVVWLHNGKRLHSESNYGKVDDDENEKELDGEENGEEKDYANNENDKKASSNDDKEGRFHLVIANISRHQTGVYSCMVTNIAGMGTSENALNVSVLYPPEVRLEIFPSLAIEHETNVTLTCDIEAANPPEVTVVRWYRGEEVFNETDETTLVLHEVDRTAHNNYSCQVENRVGYGKISESLVVNVLYTPGRARITHDPRLVIKDEPVTLFCIVEDLGNPPVTEYVWKRGEFFFPDVHTRNWSMEAANLQTQEDYICIPKNKAGEGIPGTIELDVNAPPAFIDSLLPEHGALESAADITLTCQVECQPRCTIEWLRNDEVLHVGNTEGEDDEDEDSERPDNEMENEASNHQAHKKEKGDYYSVKISYLPANPRTNHFPSVVSSLRWNMTAWPKGHLDRLQDSANYTCRSTPNLAGPSVSSATVFQVEYPPENITLSTYMLVIEEGQKSAPVVCLADGHPEVFYKWTYEGELISSTSELHLDYPASRDRSGKYVCTASNIHGNVSASVHLDVQFAPECKLEAHMKDDIGTVLTCEVFANPPIVEFQWFVDNETIDENVNTESSVSHLSKVRSGGHYTCVANNSVGVSEGCILKLQGADGALLVGGFADNRIIIIVVVVAAIVIIAVIVAVIIILVMKRRSAAGKLDKQRRSDQPMGPVSDGDRAFYENLPFHGLQPAPNKPFKPTLPDLEYADVDFPPQAPQSDGTPQRPPRSGKPVSNNNHA